MSRSPSRVIPFRRQRRPKARWRLSPILVVLPFAAFTAAFLWDGSPPGWAFDFAKRAVPATLGPAPGTTDRETARFASCAGAVRVNCVVDGDTFWYHGQKIRIADINTPETSEPQCAREAELGAQATARLTQLLNAGAFSLETGERAQDRYGRALRVVTRGGESIGTTLEREGLAEHWKGYRGQWC